MLEESYEIEEQLATTDMSTVAEQFTKMVAGIQKRFDALKSKAAKAEELETELTSIKTAIAQEQETKAAEAKLNDRKNALAEIGIELTDERKEFFTTMADEVFSQYVEDLKTVKGTRTVADVKKPIIPEPTQSGSVSITASSLAEIAALIRGNK
jgi:predicted  nucleic acid-binding Zn-ribbon protein